MNHGDLKNPKRRFVHGTASGLHFTVYQWQEGKEKKKKKDVITAIKHELPIP